MTTHNLHNDAEKLCNNVDSLEIGGGDGPEAIGPFANFTAQLPSGYSGCDARINFIGNVSAFDTSEQLYVDTALDFFITGEEAGYLLLSNSQGKSRLELINTGVDKYALVITNELGQTFSKEDILLLAGKPLSLFWKVGDRTAYNYGNIGFPDSSNNWTYCNFDVSPFLDMTGQIIWDTLHMTNGVSVLQYRCKCYGNQSSHYFEAADITADGTWHSTHSTPAYTLSFIGVHTIDNVIGIQ